MGTPQKPVDCCDYCCHEVPLPGWFQCATYMENEMRTGTHPTIWSPIVGAICLTLVGSLFTGCMWNRSLRGGESPQDEPVKVNLTLKQKSEIDEENKTYRADNDQKKFNEEQAFLFNSLKNEIDPCRDTDDCSHEKIVFDAANNLSADLFIVEFDDQGRPYYPQQIEHLFEFLKNTMAPRSGCQPSEKDPCFDDVSLVVAAHGWRHNASFADRNVRELRQILYSAVLMEQDSKMATDQHSQSQSNSHLNPSAQPRKVVGVYVGWRGAFIDENAPIPILHRIPIPFTDMNLSSAILGGVALTTFWDRKRVAMDVALGSTRELFSRLGHLRSYVNTPILEIEKERKLLSLPFGRDLESYTKCMGRAKAENGTCLPMRALIIGHSFGSLAIYNAISASLIEAVSVGIDEGVAAKGEETSRSQTELCNSKVEPIFSKHADLIILINPAFEGARFEPLYQVSRRRTQTVGYACTQTPVLAIITGTTDTATRVAFPAGRALSTLFTSVSPKGKDNESLETLKRQESTAERHAVGHIPRYMTHYLDRFPDTSLEKQLGGGKIPADESTAMATCLTNDWRVLSTALTSNGSGTNKLEKAIRNIRNEWKPAQLGQPWPARAFCGQLRLSFSMQETEEEADDPLNELPDRSEDAGPWNNQLLPTHHDDQNPNKGVVTRHPYNPIWVIRTKDDRIIDGHNGYLNPHMMGFIHQLYRDAVTIPQVQAEKR